MVLQIRHKITKDHLIYVACTLLAKDRKLSKDDIIGLLRLELERHGSDSRLDFEPYAHLYYEAKNYVDKKFT